MLAEVLKGIFSTDDSKIWIAVDVDELTIEQGDDMICLSVEDFARFVTEVNAIIDKDITTPASARAALQVDPAEAHAVQVEIGELAARLGSDLLASGERHGALHPAEFEHGARTGLSAYRECYELVRTYAPLWADTANTSYDPTLAAAARSALEAAR